MNPKHIWVVFKKEVKDIMRDKRAVITSILIPMILIPVINMLVGGNIEKLNKEITENITIALSKDSNTEEIRELVQNQIIKDHPNLHLITVDDPMDAIDRSEIRAVLDFETDCLEKLESGEPFTIKVYYDSSQTKSGGSLGVIWGIINEFNQKIVGERLELYGLSKDVLTPAIIEESNIASEEETAGSILSMIFPLMLVILLSTGGLAPATDLVAGEKERNTFEPLLTTRPSRTSILLGKYLTVTLFSFITVMATGIGLILGYIINPSSLSMGSGVNVTGFSIPTPALLLSLLISITLGMTFAALQIALSTYARSFKEAQTYLSFLMIGIMIPGYATMFVQSNEIPFYMFFVPVMNVLSSFKIVFGYNINYMYLATALVSSMVYVAISLWLASSLFKKEKFIFRR